MKNSFGKELKRLREAKGLSQWELSRRLGYVTNSYISTIEKGAFIPSEEKLKGIARALGVSLGSIQRSALESRLVSVFKDYPQLTRKDREAIIRAYLNIKEAQPRKHEKHHRQEGR